jgi:hypothetical protein
MLPLGERAAAMLTQVCVGVSLFLETGNNATKQAAAWQHPQSENLSD